MRSDRLKLFSHSRPMGSLDNAFEEEIIFKFITKVASTVSQSSLSERTDTLERADVNNDLSSNLDSYKYINNDNNSKSISDNNNNNKNNDNNNDITSINIINNNDDSNLLGEQMKTNRLNKYQRERILIDSTILSSKSKLTFSDLPFIIEPKIDGLSLAIRYNSAGDLISAGTRGDGMEGEDVTANIQVKEIENRTQKIDKR